MIFTISCHWEPRQIAVVVGTQTRSSPFPSAMHACAPLASPQPPPLPSPPLDKAVTPRQSSHTTRSLFVATEEQKNRKSEKRETKREGENKAVKSPTSLCGLDERCILLLIAVTAGR